MYCNLTIVMIKDHACVQWWYQIKMLSYIGIEGVDVYGDGDDGGDGDFKCYGDGGDGDCKCYGDGDGKRVVGDGNGYGNGVDAW